MANKTQRIDERYQIRRGPDGTLLVSLDGVKWLTPSQAGVATEAYADEGDADTLALSQEYADTKAQETREYTDDQVELAKEEAQNYTDDQLVDLSADIEDELALKADLVNGRVPASQLPTFADTLEVFPVLADFPAAGESNVLYVAEDTNYAYRWNGSGYTRVGETLVLGETLDTAYRGDRGKVAYDHTLLTDNPHQVNKTQVGLSNVDNTSDLSKPISTATQTALNGKANTTHTHALSQVTGLQTALDSKASAGALANVELDVSDLQLDVAGKEDSFTKGNIVQGSNVTITGTLTNRLVGAGDITISAVPGATPPVTSVNTKTGNVVLVASDVGLGNVSNTSDATKNSATATLTNKRIDPRTSSAASAAAITPNVGSFDFYVLTAQAVALTINAPAGTPVAGNKLMFSIKDNGTAQTLTWNAAFVPVGVDLPLTTVADKVLYVGAIYSGTDWHVIAVAQES